MQCNGVEVGELRAENGHARILADALTQTTCTVEPQQGQKWSAVAACDVSEAKEDDWADTPCAYNLSLQLAHDTATEYGLQSAGELSRLMRDGYEASEARSALLGWGQEVRHHPKARKTDISWADTFDEVYGPAPTGTN